MRVKLLPPSSTELPAFNPILPPAAVTQILLLANPHKVPGHHTLPLASSLRLINILSPRITGESASAVQADLRPGRQSSWRIWRCGPVPSTQHLGEAVIAKTALDPLDWVWSCPVLVTAASARPTRTTQERMLKSAFTRCLPSPPRCLSSSSSSSSHAAFSVSPQGVIDLD